MHERLPNRYILNNLPSGNSDPIGDDRSSLQSRYNSCSGAGIGRRSIPSGADIKLTMTIAYIYE